MKKKFVSTLVALLLVIVLASTALAAPLAGERQLPLKGSVETTEIPNVIFPYNYVSLTGNGNATQLGQFTYNMQAVLFLPTLTARSVTATIVAADGSSLFAEGTGQGTIITPPFIVSIVETLTITGGTGRFDGAQGTVVVERVLNRATGASSGTISGTIELP
jgi:hypothetical protein